MRRHDSQDDRGAFQLTGDFDVRGKSKTGKIDIVFASALEAIGEIGFVDPQPDPLESRREDNGQGRAPTPRADDRKVHFRFHAKTFSVPARRRTILALCRHTMKAPASRAA